MNSCIYNGLVTHTRFKPIKHFLKCNLNAIDASFASNKIKKELILLMSDENISS